MKQTTLDFALSPSYHAADFVVSACNAEAKAQVDAWPNWPAYGLVLVGEKASGKSHLAHIWAAQSAAVEIHATDDIATLPNSALLIEAADYWKTAELEAKLFHLLNLTKERQQSILLTANTSPALWPMTLKDLKSRLNALPQATLHAPDEALLSAVLSKHFQDRQVLVDAGVIHYLTNRMERNFAEARRIAGALDALALEQKRAITLPLARQVLV